MKREKTISSVRVKKSQKNSIMYKEQMSNRFIHF